MSPSVLVSLIEQRFGLQFSEAAFSKVATIEEGAERIRELKPEAETSSREEISRILSAAPGWRVCPSDPNAQLTKFLPKADAHAFWQRLRVEAGVDRWPALEDVSLMPKWHLGVIALIPPIVFFGALWLTDEWMLASLIGGLNVAYLIAFCLQRLRETHPRTVPADLTLGALAEMIRQRRKELAAPPWCEIASESPESLAARLRADST